MHPVDITITLRDRAGREETITHVHHVEEEDEDTLAIYQHLSGFDDDKEFRDEYDPKEWRVTEVKSTEEENKNNHE